MKNHTHLKSLITIAAIGIVSTMPLHGETERLPSLVEQAKFLERACAFVLNTNGDPIGTGFFVEQNIPEPGIYFVTARHVLEAPGLFSAKHAVLKLRINSVDGKSGEESSNLLALDGERPWLEHKNDAVDIAVVPILALRKERPNPQLGLTCISYVNRPTKPIVIDNRWIFALVFPRNEKVNFANAPFRKRYGIDVGSPILTMGLVPMIEIRNPLRKGNLPNLIMQKRGYIGAIPQVPMVTHSPRHPVGLAKSIFIDCQVVHGNSGSPVFVQTPSPTNEMSKSYHLLGIASAITPDVLSPTNMNWGSDVSCIVPVDYLCDILEYPETEALQRELNRCFIKSQEYHKEREAVLKQCKEVMESSKSVTNEQEVAILQEKAKQLLERSKKLLEMEKEVNRNLFKRYRTDDWDEPRDGLKPKPYFNYW